MSFRNLEVPYFSQRLNASNLSTRIKPDTYTNPGSLRELRNTTALALLIEIGTMDDEEGRKIMYEREKILSKKIADILKSFNKDRPNWN